MAAVIPYAVHEAVTLLRRRGAVSAVLALSLAVPLSLAGFTTSLGLWSRPMVALEGEAAVVRVLLHPRMDESQRQAWIEDQRRAHPNWSVAEIDNDTLAGRLTQWFPYLRDLLKGDRAIELPILVEISTDDPQSVAGLIDSPAVIAVGPTASVDRVLGRIAGKMAWLMGGLSVILLLSALLLSATWIHLEVYRHADEITIMRLVGATEGAIRSPFIIGALIPGFVSGVLAAIGTRVLVSSVGAALSAVGLGAPRAPWWLLVSEFAAALVLPFLAAVLTLVRHARHEDGV